MHHTYANTYPSTCVRPESSSTMNKIERLTHELIQDLCNSPAKLRQYAKEQAAKYPLPDIFKKSQNKTGSKRKATTKLDDYRPLKVAKFCDLFGMKEKDALNRSLTAIGSVGASNPNSTIGSINGDEASSTTSNRAGTHDTNYAVVDNECSTIEMNLRRLCALCKLSHPEMRPTIIPKTGTPKVTEKGVWEEEYKVSKVIKLEFDGKKPKYEVKWEGYNDTTWEPVKNIWDCSAFQAFTDSFIRSRKTEMEILWNEIITKISNESLVPELSDSDAIEQTKRFNYNDFLSYFFMMVRMRRAGKHQRTKDYQKVYEFLLNDMKYLQYYIARLEQLQDMHEFQQRINIVDQSKNLHVENVVDMERPPISEFTYTNDVIPRDGIVIPDDPPVGCVCTTEKDGVCSGKSKCCPETFDAEFAYNSRGLIRVKQGTPIFECNKACKCSENCPNRVVQKGRKQTLCIFKTKERGWGVRTERAIAKGQYICEYVGEIISYEETERRGKEYDAVGRTYLFDLDFNEKDNPYTVDAAKFGNVSRFINHSCDPNLGVWAVWTNCLDLNLPKLCLFALRPIKENEELTFDYVNSTCSAREQDGDGSAEANGSKTENKALKVDSFDALETTDTKLDNLEKLDQESNGQSTPNGTECELIIKNEINEEILIKQDSNDPIENETTEKVEEKEKSLHTMTDDARLNTTDDEKVESTDEEKLKQLKITDLFKVKENKAKEPSNSTKKEGFTCRCNTAKCRNIIFC